MRPTTPSRGDPRRATVLVEDSRPEDSDPWEILVVDDDEDVRELLVEFFRGRGSAVASASDGRAAVDALQRSAGRYGLVLTDINMPGADGFQVLMAARAANAAAYVVMITGYASLDSAVRAVKLGAHDYLAKPFTLGQIDVVAQKARARFQLEQENRSLLSGESSPALDAIDGRLTAIEQTLGQILRDLNPAR